MEGNGVGCLSSIQGPKMSQKALLPKVQNNKQHIDGHVSLLGQMAEGTTCNMLSAKKCTENTEVQAISTIVWEGILIREG